jgi:UDP-N-acetylglucosamine 2-epimerase (non-hydrolysing)/GDP/UDP-N,N'-diacetylbacillosamine 2-epimerase (hydrolysing)
VTTELDDSAEQITETLAAVRAHDVQGVVIYPNNDAGAQAIIRAIQDSGLSLIRSLPPEQFVNLVRYAGALVGNSSSGIHETASLGVPTVNVGNRQHGRQRPPNVLDAPNSRHEITMALATALYDRDFKARVAQRVNPYGDGRSAERIVRVLKSIELDDLIHKRFYDESADHSPDRGDRLYRPALA